jgi:LPXTG-motif cell wall-anchored protein/uncharacterized repeat protein (TIGR02543 family)
MTKLFKALGATLLTAGLVIAGVAAPAYAVAGLSLSSNTIATSTATTAGFYAELTGTTIQNNMDTILVGPPSGWTLVNTCPLFANATAGNESNCGISSVTIGGTAVTGWKAYWDGSSPKVRMYKVNAGTGFTSGDAIKVTFAAGAWTSPSTSSSSPFALTTMYNGGATLDNVSATITVGTPSYTVLYNSNGGSGTMSTQSASTATALSTNTFTRSGFTFAGWNTAANGTGTAYANGASYPFTSNTTLYAQWTASSSGGSSSSNTLANTGIDSTNGIMFLLGGLSLALIGTEMLIIARRKRSN